MIAELLYRDAASYKYRCEYGVPTEYIDIFKKVKEYGDGVPCAELGIHEDALQDLFALPEYDPELDHTIIEVEELIETSETNNPTDVDQAIEDLDNELTEAIEMGVNINRILLGKLISDYLTENKVTITTLADASGVSREQIGWLMTGKRDPRMSTLLKVLVAMKYTLVIEKDE